MRTESTKNCDQATDDERVGRLISRLGRVDAPPDFEARVRARIAARSAAPKPRRVRWLLPAASTIALLVVLALLIPNAFRRDSQVLATAVRTDSIAVNIIPRLPDDVGVPDGRTADPTVPDSKPRLVRTRRPYRDERSSVDFSLRQSRRGPPRAASDPKIGAHPFQSPASITIGSVLTDLGIESNVVGRSIFVRSVRENSVAARSGVTVGDSVVAIDSRSVDATTVFERTVSGGTITVVRDGIPIILKLQ